MKKQYSKLKNKQTLTYYYGLKFNSGLSNFFDSGSGYNIIFSRYYSKFLKINFLNKFNSLAMCENEILTELESPFIKSPFNGYNINYK